jgi:hypothetical protein
VNPVLYAQFNISSGVTDRIVRLEDGQWIGADAKPVELTISSARAATEDEAAAYEECRLTHRLATMTEERGAAGLALFLDATGAIRDDELCCVVDALRARGRDGLASQVAAMRWTEAS